MDSLSEIVEVVIGVDTHVRTHSAAAVNAHTGGVLGEITVEATPKAMTSLLSSQVSTKAFGPGQSRARAATGQG
jgi:hypothetical protein